MKAFEMTCLQRICLLDTPAHHPKYRSSACWPKSCLWLLQGRARTCHPLRKPCHFLPEAAERTKDQRDIPHFANEVERTVLLTRYVCMMLLMQVDCPTAA